MGLGGKITLKIRRRLQRRPRKRKVARVSNVSIDQPVVCPSCGNSMRLSELLTFQCKRCAQELTAEEALIILETAGA